jgi:ABC-2 type transport system ATP-binding protein
MLRLENIVKLYSNHVAVDDVSFEIPEGKIFGMLGPNGAGKTSTIRIITGITRADSGTVFFNGKKLTSDMVAQIGYMPEERGLYKKMKIGEQLIYLGQLKGMSYADARQETINWLVKLDIKEWWGKKVEELSKGMQQKTQFIATVLHRPSLLILDEPFSGLDPVNANLIKEEIDLLHRNGTTIIFSTHRMEQVEEICDSIVLIHKGKNVLEGDVKAVKDQFKENLFEITYNGALPELANFCEVVSNQSQKATLKLHEGIQSNQILSQFIQSNTLIVAFQEKLPTLNEIFIKQVGGDRVE